MPVEMHPDDEFHASTTDDPEWTETCWFTFTVPERGLSGQLYPYFKQNQGVAAGGAFFWDGHHERPETCVYAKQFWHLPLAEDARLTDIRLDNGISYTCLEPQKRWAVRYDDPDGGDEIHVDLTFTGVVPPNMLGTSHVDQAGRYRGDDRPPTGRRSRSTPTACATDRGAPAPVRPGDPRRGQHAGRLQLRHGVRQ